MVARPLLTLDLQAAASELSMCPSADQRLSVNGAAQPTAAYRPAPTTYRSGIARVRFPTEGSWRCVVCQQCSPDRGDETTVGMRDGPPQLGSVRNEKTMTAGRVCLLVPSTREHLLLGYRCSSTEFPVLFARCIPDAGRLAAKAEAADGYGGFAVRPGVVFLRSVPLPDVSRESISPVGSGPAMTVFESLFWQHDGTYAESRYQVVDKRGFADRFGEAVDHAGRTFSRLVAARQTLAFWGVVAAPGRLVWMDDVPDGLAVVTAEVTSATAKREERNATRRLARQRAQGEGLVKQYQERGSAEVMRGYEEDEAEVAARRRHGSPSEPAGVLDWLMNPRDPPGLLEWLTSPRKQRRR